MAGKALGGLAMLEWAEELLQRSGLFRNPGGGAGRQCGLPCGLPLMPCAVSFLINTALGGKRPQLPIRPLGPRGGGEGGGARLWGQARRPRPGVGLEQHPPPPREWVPQRGLRPLSSARSADGSFLAFMGAAAPLLLPGESEFWFGAPRPQVTHDCATWA